MIIWFALLIPVLVTGYLLLFQRERVNWWEIALVFAVPLVLIPVAKFTIQSVQTRDVEYWGGWVTSAVYYEPWDERVSCSHPITDSKGNTTGYWHAYDVDYHPEYWEANGSNGENTGIDKQLFERLCQKFGNRSFRELNRDFHQQDGDSYVAIFTGEESKMEPWVTRHTYENRTQAADTVYKFPEVPDEEVKRLGLYEYPDIIGYYECPTVLSRSNSLVSTSGPVFERINAKLGRSKQVRLWVLLFQDQPMSTAIAQEHYWRGGNKNELVVCIGVDKQKNIEWTRVFSWTEKNTIEIETRDYLMSQEKLDLPAFASWIEPEIVNKWERKQFKEFSYLTVNPPLWAVIIVWLLTLAADVGIAFYVVNNEYDKDGYRNRWRY